MKNWLLSLFVNNQFTVIQVGTRVSTKHGRGVVVGGNLIVRLDNSPSVADHPNQHQWTYNIDKDKIEYT